MKQAVSWTIVLLFGAYLIGYLAFRGMHTEMVEADESSSAYVIFPKDNAWLYDFFRPMTYVDGAVTGIQFHIGPHERPATPPPASKDEEGD